MKKLNKKGFTLIELLAVIVILGLLMAIAIPSVTKYITQSRKKTLVSSVNSYISAVTASVNNMDYTFTDPDVIYGVPVECIALEKGGKNPFGDWAPAGENTWAYVLVQYDDVNSSYTYGFTFKDSAGYGMLPLASNKIDAKGNDVTNAAATTLNGKWDAVMDATVADDATTAEVDETAYPKASVYYSADDWEDAGFDVDSDTEIHFLSTDTSKPATCTKAE